MKKYLPIIAVLFIIPSVAFASWWNPTTWFQSSNVENVQPVQQMTQQFSTSTEATSTISSPINATSTASIPAVNQSAITTSQNALHSEINVLTAQNNSLQSKLNAIENQLAVVQKNYSMCQVSLTAAQNTNTVSQVQQPTAPQIVPVVAPPTASISTDYNNPIAHTVSSTNGQYLGLPVLTFDIQPSSDQSVNSITVGINSAGQGNVNTANLYSGGYTNPIATAVVSNGTATFSNLMSIPSLSIHSGPYNTFMIKVDVSGLTTVGYSESVSASVSSAKITDSTGRDVNVTGTAQGNVISVTNNATTTSPSNNTTILGGVHA
jgi:hypothetical protein